MRANTHTHHSSFARNAGEYSPLITLHSPATRANSHTHHSSFARNAGEYSHSSHFTRPQRGRISPPLHLWRGGRGVRSEENAGEYSHSSHFTRPQRGRILTLITLHSPATRANSPPLHLWRGGRSDTLARNICFLTKNCRQYSKIDVSLSVRRCVENSIHQAHKL